MANITGIPYSLQVGNADPIDRRLTLTKAEMLAMNQMKMPRSDITKYFALCTDNNKFYYYDKNATTTDPETGYFFPVTTAVAVATSSSIGGVLSSTAENSVSVLSDGTMQLNSISSTKLVSDPTVPLSLDGGASS